MKDPIEQARVAGPYTYVSYFSDKKQIDAVIKSIRISQKYSKFDFVNLQKIKVRVFI